MPPIDSLSTEDWKRFVSISNQTAMKKSHKYPCYEETFLANCCVKQPPCKSSCFCTKVGCEGIWILRPDVEFQVFLSHFTNLWVRGSLSFGRAVNDADFELPPRWPNGI